MKQMLLLILIIQITASDSYTQGTKEIPINNDGIVTKISVKIGHIIVPNIILDTGFPYDGLIIYNPDYNDSLDLSKAVEAKIGGAGSGNASNALLIDSGEFYIGDLRFKNHKIILIKDNLYKGYSSNGVIGYSILGHYKTMLNYDNNTMTLFNFDDKLSDTTWNKIPIYFKNNNIPWTDAYISINDEKPVLLSTYIDFAARDVIVLLEKSNMKFSIPKDTKKVYLGRGLSGDIYGKEGRISKLNISGIKLRNLKAFISKSKERSKQKDADAILGCGAFQGFNLIFDYKNYFIYYKPNKKIAK